MAMTMEAANTNISEFVDFLKYCRNLQFEEEPNYDYLRGLFINLLNFYQFKNDLNFSWIQKNQRNKRQDCSKPGTKKTGC